MVSAGQFICFLSRELLLAGKVLISLKSGHSTIDMTQRNGKFTASVSVGLGVYTVPESLCEATALTQLYKPGLRMRVHLAIASLKYFYF